MIYQMHRDNAEYFRFGYTLCSLHFHRAIELVYCIETQKPVGVRGEEMILEEGELLLVPPLCSHIFPPKKKMHALCVVMPVAYSDLLEQQTGGKRIANLIVHDKALAKDIYDHLCMLESCRSPLLRDSIYRYCLARLLEQAVLTEEKAAETSDFAAEVLRYIQQHYTEKLTSEMVAAALGYNPCYFSSAFNRRFRMTFPAYLNGYRVDRAKSLLQKFPAAEVAERVGFTSPQSFYRNFKAVTGKTPSEYRRAKK